MVKSLIFIVFCVALAGCISRNDFYPGPAALHEAKARLVELHEGMPRQLVEMKLHPLKDPHPGFNWNISGLFIIEYLILPGVKVSLTYNSNELLGAVPTELFIYPTNSLPGKSERILLSEIQ